MSLFARSICRHSPVQALWQRHQLVLGRHCVATAAESMYFVGLPLPRREIVPRKTLFHLTTSCFENIGSVATTTSSSLITVGEKLVDSLQSLLGDLSTWFIKRTYQPSIIRKRRKHGFRRRKESVGGRRVLKRRMAKGRIRLGGCWLRQLVCWNNITVHVYSESMNER